MFARYGRVIKSTAPSLLIQIDETVKQCPKESKGKPGRLNVRSEIFHPSFFRVSIQIKIHLPRPDRNAYKDMKA
jgi:hypothetical protein